MSDLVGKTVAVVGGSSGIGLATARLTSQSGARVVMLSRYKEKLARAAQSVAGEPVTIALDATDADVAIAPRLAERGSITLMCGASRSSHRSRGLRCWRRRTLRCRGSAARSRSNRVNVVMAGVVDTPIHDHDREDLKGWAERELPARRFGQPEDIAHPILFLMTNPYATAQTFVVDGGLTII